MIDKIFLVLVFLVGLVVFFENRGPVWFNYLVKAVGFLVAIYSVVKLAGWQS